MPVTGDSLAEFGNEGEKTDISGLYKNVGWLRPAAIEEFVYSSRLGVVLALNLVRLAASLRRRDAVGDS